MMVKCTVSHELRNQGGGYRVFEAGVEYDVVDPSPVFFAVNPPAAQAPTDNEEA